MAAADFVLTIDTRSAVQALKELAEAAEKAGISAARFGQIWVDNEPVTLLGGCVPKVLSSGDAPKVKPKVKRRIEL